jgi:hypothetical protein
LQPSLQFALGAAPVSASVSAGDASELPEPPPPPCSSGLFVREPFGSKETKELIKQLNGTVQSAFGRSGARKLVRIVPDWAKHSDAAQVWSALRIVLRECKRITDAGHLRRVLSGFFLALPERLEESGRFRVCEAGSEVEIKRALVALVSSVSIVIQAAISLSQPKTDDRTGD